MLIERKFDRSFLIENSNKSVLTPFFFPAISSIKAQLPVIEYLKIAAKTNYPGILVSAYDLDKLPEKDLLSVKRIINGTNRGNMSVLDSGMFEAFWYKDKKWNFSKLKNILTQSSFDLCFSFDIFWDKKLSSDDYLKKSITSLLKTASFQNTGSTIPIVHSHPKTLPILVNKIIRQANPEIVAVAERELGTDIFERARTINSIRKEIDKLKKEVPLHVLGVGNPKSMVAYTAAGADTYDGTEWYTSALNPGNYQLVDFSYLNTFDCQCKACKNQKIPYLIKVINHNLLLYKYIVDKMTNSIENNRFDVLFNEFFGKNVVKEFKKIV